jgi:hypothetical protein
MAVGNSSSLPFLSTVAVLLLLRPLATLLSWLIPLPIAEGLSAALLLLASGSLAILLGRSPWGFGRLILLSAGLGVVAFIFAWLIPSR